VILSSVWPFLFLCFAAFVASAAFVGLFIKFANKIALVDVPNKRSSHVIPTPRGGGVVFVALYSFFGVLAYFQGALSLNNFIIFSAPVFVAVLSLIDDIISLSARLRLFFHALFVIGILIFYGDLPALPFLGWQFDSQYFLFPLYVLIGVGLINIFNFMDGIDGYVSISSLAWLLLLASFYSGYVSLYLAPYLASILLGFVVWNFPKAGVFMGDVGSTFLGLTFFICILETAKEIDLTLWFWLICLVPFWVDSLYTMITRYLSGQRWYEAHRLHIYQKLSVRWKSHTRVVLAALLMILMLNIPLALLSHVFQDLGPALLLLAVLPVIIIGYKIRAGLLE